MNLRNILFSEVLPNVTKPSRYLGTEFNTVHKNARDVDVRIALVFPDLYDLGLGNLGLHVLYAILNRLPWCWAERACAPAPDMEAVLRARGLPLFALESKDSLDTMDLIGFTLQSELTYTNVLNVIDLAGVPLRSVDRDDRHPLIFAGGPAAVNPEPLSPFIDFFVIGDGEEVIVEIAHTARATQRADRLRALATIRGVYVPELYPFDTLADGRIVPAEHGPRIVRRVVQNLNNAPFPEDYLVPYTQLIHDRVGLEVLRGCTHGCRFCQAGMINRPVRIRGIDEIDGLMERVMANTGYEELSLLSLSTCDYPDIRTLLHRAAERGRVDNAAVSLPSLRLDTFSVELADAITGVRRSGLTFAPEAATSRLRTVINKWYEDEDLFQVVEEAFKRGWNHVKLYFMIGLPTETDEDVEAIIDLCGRVLKRARAVTSRAQINLGVSTFVPKPFTPFQWAAQITHDEIKRRQRILDNGFRRQRAIKFGRHEPESSFIEGLLARADRRAADLIEAAFRKGARLESSSEHINFQVWLDAIEEVGYDVDAAFRERDLNERLPWDHIDVLIPKEWLQAEFERARQLETTADCRVDGCRMCGIRGNLPGTCSVMTAASRAAQQDNSKELPPLLDHSEPAAVQRLRFRIGRSDEASFLSHLEVMNAWVRILRRTHAPLSYSQGFHAHPKVTFAAASPVGEASEGDYMDIVLKDRVDPATLIDRVRATLPAGFHVYEITEAPLNAPSLMSALTGFDYTLRTSSEAAPLDLAKRIESLITQTSIIIERKRKPDSRGRSQGVQQVDIRPAIHALAIRITAPDEVLIDFCTEATDGGTMAKPKEIIQLLELNPATTQVTKRATHLR